MYLRFVVTQLDDDSHQPKGLFILAQELLASGDLSPDERQQIEELMIWFIHNLPSPTLPSGRHEVTARAIFWFKSEAVACLSRIWEMVEIMKYHGYLVEMQKCCRLGNIVYEDRYQVAAIPSTQDHR